MLLIFSFSILILTSEYPVARVQGYLKSVSRFVVCFYFERMHNLFGNSGQAVHQELIIINNSKVWMSVAVADWQHAFVTIFFFYTLTRRGCGQFCHDTNKK